MRAHSRANAVPFVAERKRHIIAEVEWIIYNWFYTLVWIFDGLWPIIVIMLYISFMQKRRVDYLLHTCWYSGTCKNRDIDAWAPCYASGREIRSSEAVENARKSPPFFSAMFVGKVEWRYRFWCKTWSAQAYNLRIGLLNSLRSLPWRI